MNRASSQLCDITHLMSTPVGASEVSECVSSLVGRLLLAPVHGTRVFASGEHVVKSLDATTKVSVQLQVPNRSYRNPCRILALSRRLK